MRTGPMRRMQEYEDERQQEMLRALSRSKAADEPTPPVQ